MRASLIAVVLLLAAIPDSAWSIIIETAPGKRVSGHLVSENATQLGIRVKDKVEVFDKAKVTVIHRIKWDRVEALDPKSAKTYRDLGEEMAEKAADPEARDLAVRLFLIAAHLDPENLGRGSLLQMAALAASPDEARKYRAMAYLLDPKHDPSLLTMPKAAVKKEDPLGTHNFVQAIRSFRVGKLDNAKKFGAMDGVAPCFDQVPGLMTHKEFLSTCTDAKCKTCAATGKSRCPTCSGTGKVRNMANLFVMCQNCNGFGKRTCNECGGPGHTLNLTSEQVQVFLRAELWAVNKSLGAHEAAPKDTAVKKWSDLVTNPRLGPVPVLTLESLTPFNPRQCVYRNGAWVEP